MIIMLVTTQNTTLCIMAMVSSFHAFSVPTEPLGVNVSRAIGMPRKISVNWEVPTKQNGVITAYTIYCAETEEPKMPDIRTVPPPPENMTVNCTVDGSGNGSSSSATGAIMDLGSSSDNGSGDHNRDEFTNMSSTGSTSGSKVLSCKGQSSGNASDTAGSGLIPEPVIQLNYTIIVTVGGEQTNVLVPELTPYTWYRCYVTANTSIGEGERSSTDVDISDEAGTSK